MTSGRPAEAAGERYAQVVVEVAPAHLDRPFDYRVPPDVAVQVGQRVRVPFSGRRRTGWVVGVAAETVADPGKLRDLGTVDGDHTWFDEDDLTLYRWVAKRYAATLADVLRHALPARVAAVEREPSDEAPTVPSDAVASLDVWRHYGAAGLLAAVSGSGPPGAFWWRPLHGEDVTALALDLVGRCLAARRGVVVVAPDPGSPLPAAALGLAGSDGADLRAARTQRDRYRAFLRARAGHCTVVVGERSGVFAPVANIGLILVDDEASPAYKERRAPRHHARDVALARARMSGATAVLLGDLPSARLWRLLQEGHVRPVRAERGLERDRAPRVDVVDRSDPRPGARRGRFSEVTARAITGALRARGVAVVVAARGGQGAALACQTCGTRRACPVCDGSVRPARQGEIWDCPACGWQGPAFACSSCGGHSTAPLAAGAGRLAQELTRAHPQAQVVRMEGFDAPGPTSRPAVAVMTRGSAVTRPSWLGQEGAAVVALPDADALLRLPILDASEDALRLWFAVARWTRHVVIQTREPRDPAVQALVRWDPDGYWHSEAQRRAELRYPPAGSLIRVVTQPEQAAEVAAALRDALPADDEVLGPDPDGALLVKTADLRATLESLTPLRHTWSQTGRTVRVDVDPV